MLQVSEKTGKGKRKALLVETTDTASEVATGRELEGQRHYPGEPFNRMRQDPDLVRASRRLFAGVVVVGGLIFCVTVWSLVAAWKKSPNQVESSVTEKPIKNIPESPHIQRPQVAPMFSPQMDFEQIVKRRQLELTEMGRRGEE
jgi:hypothetical protein